jgi:hypothetical protein
MNELNDWRMPEWMEPFRNLIHNTGGNTVEYMMNYKGDLIINAPVTVLSACVKSQVGLLITLHEENFI